MSPVPDPFGLLAMRSEIDALKARVSNQQSQINSLKSQLGSAYSQINSLKSQLNTLKSQVGRIPRLTSAQLSMLNTLVGKSSVVNNLLADGPKLHTFITNPADTVNSLADARIKALVTSSFINPLVTKERVNSLLTSLYPNAGSVLGQWSNIRKIPSMLSDIRDLETDLPSDADIKALINANYIKGIIDPAYIRGIINKAYIKAFWPRLDNINKFAGRLGGLKSDFTSMKGDVVDYIAAHKSFINAIGSIVTTLDDMATGGPDRTRPSVASWALSLYNNFSTLKSRGDTLKTRLDALDDEFNDIINRFDV